MHKTALGRCMIGLAVLIAVGLIYTLIFGEGGILQHQELKKQIESQQQHNQDLASDNRILAAEVFDLKNGKEALEEHARLDLGLIKSNETFVQTSLIEDKSLIHIVEDEPENKP